MLVSHAQRQQQWRWQPWWQTVAVAASAPTEAAAGYPPRAFLPLSSALTHLFIEASCQEHVHHPSHSSDGPRLLPAWPVRACPRATWSRPIITRATTPGVRHCNAGWTAYQAEVYLSEFHSIIVSGQREIQCISCTTFAVPLFA